MSTITDEPIATRLNPLPELPEELRAGLRASIEKFGVLIPVIADQYGSIIDGFTRAGIAEDLGIDCPRHTVTITSDTDVEALVREINDMRRQRLTKPQRRKLVVALREAGWTYAQIAEEVGASLGTVHSDAQESEPESEPVFNSENGDERTSAIKRVRKLRALASDEAAEPGEAENATRAAERLIEKHGLTEQELAAEDSSEPDAEFQSWSEDERRQQQEYWQNYKPRVTANRVANVVWSLLCKDGDEVTIETIAESFKVGTDHPRLHQHVEAACQRKGVTIPLDAAGEIDWSQPIRYHEANPTGADWAISDLVRAVDEWDLAARAEDVVTKFDESDDPDERARLTDDLRSALGEIITLGTTIAALGHRAAQNLVAGIPTGRREWAGLDDYPTGEADR